MDTTITMKEETARVFRLLAAKSRMDVQDVLDDIAKSIETMLNDGLEETARVIFMSHCDLANSQVTIRFAPCFVGGIDQMPKEIRAKLKKDYKKESKNEKKVPPVSVDLTPKKAKA